MKKQTLSNILYLMLMVVLFASCENHDPVEQNPYHTNDMVEGLQGMYILNEGGYNQNNASLDYLDFTTGVYHLNTFAQANPNLTQGLGDVANDMVVYGGKGYICVNGSGLVEVVETKTGKHIDAINVANCRRVYAYGGYVYVTSYAGRLEDEQHQLGFVGKIDTTSLTVVKTCEVGYQPEGLAVTGNKMYVANSGGYVGMSTGTYDNRLSIIDLSTFTLEEHIAIASNLQEVVVDAQNQLWISSYGNYVEEAANLYCLNPQTKTFAAQNIPVTKMAISGNDLYILATTYDASWNAVTTISRFSTLTKQSTTLSFDKEVTTPCALCINPKNNDLYISDAGDYVNPGALYCFTNNGSHKWNLRTGVIPGHFAFVY